MHSSCWKFCYAMLSVYWIGAFGHVCINFSLLKEYYLLLVYFTNSLSGSGSNVVEAAAAVIEDQKKLGDARHSFSWCCHQVLVLVYLFLIVCALVGCANVYVLLWVFDWMISGFNQLIERFIILLFKCVNWNLWMKKTKCSTWQNNIWALKRLWPKL